MITQNKRASAVHVSLPWRGMLPLPDGGIDGADRYQLGWRYIAFAVGPFCVVDSQYHVPGSVSAQSHVPGSVAEQYHVPGSVSAQSC